MYKPVNGRITVTNGADVALEVPDIYRIKSDLLIHARNKARLVGVSCIAEGNATHDGHPESDVCLGKLVADEIVFASQEFLRFVEGVEYFDDRL